MAFLANVLKMEAWIVDSEITSNMTNRLDFISKFKEKRYVIGVAKINESMTSRGSGSIEFENFRLKEVMYVPDLSTNLLSVHDII